jgi:hypothetical protein
VGGVPAGQRGGGHEDLVRGAGTAAGLHHQVVGLLRAVGEVVTEGTVHAERQQVTGSRCHGAERRDPAVVQPERVQHSGVTGALELGVQRGLDDQAAGLELLLTDPESLRHVPLHVVAHVGADAGLDAAAPRGGRRRQPEGRLRRLRLLVGRDVALLGHPVEHLVAPEGGGLRVDERVVAGRALHQPGEERGLGQRQRRGVHPEVRLGGRLHAVGVLPEVDDVEVAGEQLVLAVPVLQVEGQPGFAKLAAHALLDGRCPLGRVVGRLQQGLLDQLLGQRRAALHDLAGRDVLDQCPHGALHVEATVLVEARVLDGHHRLLHHLGDPVAGDRGPVLPVEGGDQLAVGGEHGRVAGRRLVGQLLRRVTEQAGGLLRREGRPADHGQEHSREQGTGDDDAEGERAEREDRAPALLHRPPSSGAGITPTENCVTHNTPRRPYLHRDGAQRASGKPGGQSAA